jgi:uncharacterized protein (TIGR00251 family)
VSLRVRLQPRASREGLGGVREGALLVRVTAPPVEGAANEALVRLMGRILGVAPSRLRIVAGAAGRSKRLRVAGLAVAELRSRLEAASRGAKA